MRSQSELTRGADSTELGRADERPNRQTDGRMDDHDHGRHARCDRECAIRYGRE